MKYLQSYRVPIQALFVVSSLVLVTTLSSHAGPPDDPDGSDGNGVHTAVALETFAQRHIAELSEETALYMDDLTGNVGIAVVVPDQRAIYTVNGDSPFPLASIAKVLIMAMAMDNAEREKRPLSEHEISLLESMITVSDNDAATELWHRLGGVQAFSDYLNSLGLTDLELDEGDYWGDTRASAKDIAVLLARLVNGEILDPGHTALAIDLLQRVIPEQRWGIAVGEVGTSTLGVKVGVKNGWYPDESGWWVNSAGFYLIGDGSLAFTIAILTENHPTITDGIAAIEDIATLIEPPLLHRYAPPGLSLLYQPMAKDGVTSTEDPTIPDETTTDSDADDASGSD